MKTSITDKLEKARINFALRGCEANEIKVLDAFECVKQAFEKWGDNLAVSCSFGRCSVAVLHMALQIDPNVKVIFNDTTVLYPEDYAYKELLKKEWNLNIIETKPIMPFWKVWKEYGPPTIRLQYYHSYAKNKGLKKRHTFQEKTGKPACCWFCKDKPFLLASRKYGIKATLTCLRCAESRARMYYAADYGQVHYTKRHRIWKVNPILFWTIEQLKDYLKTHNIPENPLYTEKGLERNGCQPCLGPETIVYGDNLPISDLSLDNIIIGKEGLEKPFKIMKRYYEGDIIVVKPQDLFPFRITPEHPVLVAERKTVWLKTDHIRPREKHDFYYVSKRVIGEPVWKKASELKVRDYLLIPLKKKFNDFQDKELAWLMGLYLAEGWVHYTRNNYPGVFFALGKHEKALTEKLLTILKNRFNKGDLSEQKTANRIYFHGREEAKPFLECGRVGVEKHVPNLIKQAPPETVRSFLEGFIIGDGYQNERHIRMSTSNFRLVLDITELLTMNLGILPYVYKRKKQSNQIEGRIVNCQPSFTIDITKNDWNGTPYPHRKYKSDSEFLYVPITRIKVEKTKEWVYNLETESQTYCIPFIVHNCTGFINWEKQLATTNPRMYAFVQKLRGVTLLDNFLREDRLIESCAEISHKKTRQPILEDWF